MFSITKNRNPYFAYFSKLKSVQILNNLGFSNKERRNYAENCNQKQFLTVTKSSVANGLKKIIAIFKNDFNALGKIKNF